jgi:hypothetical protein
MAAFLVRAFDYSDPGEGNLFIDDDGLIFEGDIDRLGTSGITKGCNPPANDRFCPNDPVLRDQMASFLGRALELTPTHPSTTSTSIAPTTTTTLPGGFAPFTVEGSGNDVISLSVPGDAPALLDLIHDGSSNFSVVSREGNMEYIDLIVNEIGPYEGRRGLNLGWFGPEPARYLEIDADGNWNLTVRPISEARAMSGSLTGHGDEVVRYVAGTPNSMHSTHDGSSNFAIVGHESDGSYGDLIVNEIGPYNGTDVIESGVAILEIEADGNWTLDTP